MRFPAAALCAPALFCASVAFAEPLRIGVVAPLSGSAAVLGRQVEAGAVAAASSLPEVELRTADDACSAAGGAAAARQLLAEQARIVVGFLCTEAIEAALPILKEAGIPAITVGVRTNSLTDRRGRTGWPLFRLAPRTGAEVAAVGEILPRLWRDRNFAIVDDGTLYGRELAEGFRLAAEAAALSPVFTDTFRPQVADQIGLVGRLDRAGATDVFVGGERDDIAIMARDAAELELDLVFAGGEALRAAGDVPLRAGTVMIGLPEWADLADAETLGAIRGTGAEPEGYVLPAYAAVEIAAEAARIGEAGKHPLAEVLGSGAFATAIGAVRFDDNGDLAHNPYRAFRYDGARFVAMEVP